MNPTGENDALISPRLAAELAGVPAARVHSLIRDGIVREATIQGRNFVSLRAVENALGTEGDHAQTS